MAGSFDITTSRLVESTAPRTRTPDIGARPGPSTTSSSGSAGPSVGLLTASRPTPSRTASRPDPPQSPENSGSRPEYRRQNSVKTGSPLASSPAQLPLPESPSVNVQPSPRDTLYRLPSARSLPGSGSAALNPDEPLPRSAIPSMPSGSGIGYSAASQTTGYGQGMATAESRTSRRGPVLLRGGFEARSTTTGVTGSPGHGGHGRPSASSSPSHSPIRDFNRLTLSRPGAAAAGTGGGGNPTTAPAIGNAGFGNRGESMSLGYSTRKQPGQRTAPSSYGAPEVDDADDRGRARRAARKSDGGLMGVEGARSGSEVDEGLGKEERVRPVHKRSGLSGDW
jgi:autophagy-related protein 13